MFRSVHHVGIAVRDAAQAAARWARQFGLELEDTEMLPERCLKVVWARLGAVRFEFLEPLEGERTVAKFLAERGEGVHHICFDVSDAAETTGALAAAGLRLVYAEPQPGALGRQVNFVHPRDGCGVLVEFSSGP